jgi:hypothetical protein
MLPALDEGEDGRPGREVEAVSRSLGVIVCRGVDLPLVGDEADGQVPAGLEDPVLGRRGSAECSGLRGCLTRSPLKVVGRLAGSDGGAPPGQDDGKGSREELPCGAWSTSPVGASGSPSRRDVLRAPIWAAAPPGARLPWSEVMARRSDASPRQACPTLGPASCRRSPRGLPGPMVVVSTSRLPSRSVWKGISPWFRESPRERGQRETRRQCQ